ncbi:CTP:phosphocholine cytidylyltransferase-like protein [Rhizobium sp. SORGH_AS 787]|uniref:CTP:phosphocholine cytidylyltransferase-like protein n=2 Tax=Rhizobium/Agrobacterium group TaxID=227290 RepID=A0AAJ2ETY1_9HYPH|nr:CTP:phosphocholine cytidylyltransferase-like protein [Rhizobium sp. SORGH_AS_0787]MDR6104499.1 CTP:phosphocholine cytidylyltransferase-like protein [Agrobacterium larrymoorei]
MAYPSPLISLRKVSDIKTFEDKGHGASDRMQVGVGMNIVFLAAGRGSRLSELTIDTHKSLLPVAGKPALQHILDIAVASKPRDIVIVTGYKNDDIEAFIRSAYGDAIRTVLNERYASDTNILSTDIGVDALHRPHDGYQIVETDIVMQAAGWQRIFRGERNVSEWSTRGIYSYNLTGGALKADENGQVEGIVYAPQYDARYEGWSKLLGTLYVGKGEVEADRRIRKQAIGKTIAQYYMTPWAENLEELPCSKLDLSTFFAASYNDVNAYLNATQAFEKMAAGHGA